MTPTTTGRPRALLRAGVAALGVALVLLAAMNLFIVGRSATDENIFIDPVSGVYVVEHVAGTPGAPSVLSGPLTIYVTRDVTPVDALEPGDVIMAIDGDRTIRGAAQVQARLAQEPTSEVTALRARTRQTV